MQESEPVLDPGLNVLETSQERDIRMEPVRFRSVAIIAAIVCAAAALSEALGLWVSLEKLRGIADALGSSLPGVPGMVIDMNPLLVCFLYLLLAAAVFVLFAKLAKRYWIGLLFVPVMLYPVMGGELSNWLSAASLMAIQGIR